jgi:hypothetical protein
METAFNNITELGPEQRAAAEKFLGRSLANFQNVAIKVLAEGNDIVVRFFGGKEPKKEAPSPNGWKIPSCFQILSDLTDEERSDFDSVISRPVKLSRSL